MVALEYKLDGELEKFIDLFFLLLTTIMVSALNQNLPLQKIVL